MKQTDANNRLKTTIADIIQTIADLPAAWANLHEAQPGIKSTPTDTPRTNSGDPSFRTLTQIRAEQRDPTVQQFRHIQTEIDQITRRAQTLAIAVHAWAQTGTPPNIEPNCTILTEYLNRHPDQWAHDTARYRITTADRTHHAGQWAYRHIINHGQLPTDQQIHEHITRRTK